MPLTEIDEIFASKSKLEISSSSKHKGKDKASLGSRGDTRTSKKKKKKKSRSTIDEVNSSKASLPGDVTSVERKRAAPETIIDPSTLAQTSKKRKTGASVEETSSRIANKKPTQQDDLEKFRNSRGTGPRRKTDDGFSIYKEDELGIGDRGGDTPLCPFDCDCCF